MTFTQRNFKIRLLYCYWPNSKWIVSKRVISSCFAFVLSLFSTIIWSHWHEHEFWMSISMSRLRIDEILISRRIYFKSKYDLDWSRTNWAISHLLFIRHSHLTAYVIWLSVEIHSQHIHSVNFTHTHTYISFALIFLVSFVNWNHQIG